MDRVLACPPCLPANGDSTPYNVFNDELSLGVKSVASGGIHNTQSFIYQLTGQRFWRILEIDRWGGKDKPLDRGGSRFVARFVVP